MVPGQGVTGTAPHPAPGTARPAETGRGRPGDRFSRGAEGGSEAAGYSVTTISCGPLPLVFSAEA